MNCHQSHGFFPAIRHEEQAIWSPTDPRSHVFSLVSGFLSHKACYLFQKDVNGVRRSKLLQPTTNKSNEQKQNKATGTEIRLIVQMAIVLLTELFVSCKVFALWDGEQCLGPGLIDIYSPQCGLKLRTETSLLRDGEGQSCRVVGTGPCPTIMRSAHSSTKQK